jgi:type IV secretory pathway VirD2 relaxase
VKDRDDLAVFRPRVGGGQRAKPRAEGASFRNTLLAAIRRAGGSGMGRGKARRSSIGVRAPGPDARRVVVKAHVARLTATGAKAAKLHLRYIERDGVEKDGSKGVLYGADGPIGVAVFEQPRPEEKHQFRLIVSPEDAGELDLTDFVHRLMARVERDLGRRLEWAAVNHHDTEHPHAHVVVRGVDRDGREVRLDRGYISKGMRWRAQEIATEELGPRHELAIRRGHVHEVTQDRFTSLDRELERRAVNQEVKARSRERPGLIDESTLLARLEHLEQMRLAQRLSRNSWHLADGWQVTLRELGSRGDIIKQIHGAISGDPARYHVVRAGQPLPAGTEVREQTITGRVAAKGLADELKATFYAVIETPNGRAYHVPLDPRSADALRPGDIVSLRTEPEPAIRDVDRHIADAARERHGVYEIDREPSPDAQRVARRMRDLEGFGLAKPAGTRRWTVSPDLLDQLERRDGEAPVRHRLRMRKELLSVEAQTRHPGPVWLDRINAESLAPYGLGAEVRRAVEKRAEVLRSFGLANDDPNRLEKVRELERRTVGREVAARSGQSFVAGLEGDFRGQAHAHTTATGTSYTVVSDGARFVVLETTAAMRAFEGKAVTVSRDPVGRVVVRHGADRGLER